MARARNIKPAFFMNEDLVTLPFEYRLLFIGLWTLSDREGLIEDRPVKIKMELFPADNIDVNEGLIKLETLGFIERYTENDIKVISITNFKKHQSPHHTEKASNLPKKKEKQPIENMEENKQPLINGELTVNSQNNFGENPPDSLNPDSLNHESLCIGSSEHEQIENDSHKPKKSNRGSRLPDDFVMPNDWLTIGKDLRSELSEHEIRLSADKFIDYWHSATGARATKRDWLATWRNWIRDHRPNSNNVHKFPDKKPSMQANTSNINYREGLRIGSDGEYIF
ncbi:hypothetical protein [Entomomonas asaccharolytica]|uniref:Uncharacterized protein n=1 Tax=Entomomonas asaccharolytica TaxID=2785331 RepID=A0A974RY79_9GAMM|nr:hypothetical protein [Entomomonas asaccharolytica]QQP86917.1 hypothetical protein JHT90_06645 [Entomomonas asaccharolytica]